MGWQRLGNIWAKFHLGLFLLLQRSISCPCAGCVLPDSTSEIGPRSARQDPEKRAVPEWRIWGFQGKRAASIPFQRQSKPGSQMSRSSPNHPESGSSVHATTCAPGSPHSQGTGCFPAKLGRHPSGRPSFCRFAMQPRSIEVRAMRPPSADKVGRLQRLTSAATYSGFVRAPQLLAGPKSACWAVMTLGLRR